MDLIGYGLPISLLHAINYMWHGILINAILPYSIVNGNQIIP